MSYWKNDLKGLNDLITRILQSNSSSPEFLTAQGESLGRLLHLKKERSLQ